VGVGVYPYCQLAHLLIAKFNQDHESIFAPQKVRRAAAYAFNRGILRKLLNNQLPDANAGESTHIKTHVEQLDTQIEEDPVTLSDEITNGSGITETSPSFFDSISPSTPKEPESSVLDSNTTSNEPPSSIPNPTEVKEEDPIELTYPDAEIDENLALSLFNEGKLDEAILVYKRLAQLNPGERSHYYNQLSVLTGDESYKLLAEQEPDPLSSVVDPTLDPPADNASPEVTESSEGNNDEASFFENIHLDNGSLTDSDPFAEPKNKPENISEANALALYYDGKKEEAFAMYDKLMELYPEQREEFQSHLNNLKGNSTENGASSAQSSTSNTDDQSFFQGIQDDRLTQSSEESTNQ
ncbi:MAG: tetratricopeptide repeat protein, partial [Bacteroidota bacterium]